MIDYSHCWVLVCQNGDLHSAPNIIVLYSIVIRKPAVAAWLYWIISLTDRATICSQWNRYYSGYGFAFPLLDCSSESTRCGPMNDLVTVLAFPQFFFFCFFFCEQGANQTNMAIVLWLWNSLVSPCSLLPWEIWFCRCVEWHFEDSVWATPCKLGKWLEWCDIYSKPAIIMWWCFSIAGFMSTGIRCGNEWVPIILLPVIY